jgi:hypothetical protein
VSHGAVGSVIFGPLGQVAPSQLALERREVLMAHSRNLRNHFHSIQLPRRAGDCWLIALLFIFSSGATRSDAATRLTAKVADMSEPGAPIKISGDVIFEEDESKLLPYSIATDITFSNLVTKSILLSIVNLKLVSTHIRDFHTEDDDYFFQRHVLQPSSPAHLRITVPFGRSIPPYQARATKATAEARVLFVQFLDGTTWGDSSSAGPISERRIAARNVLESLSELYKAGREQDFLDQLSRTTELQPILTLQNLYDKTKNIATVATRVEEMLQNAKVHSVAVETQGSLSDD